MEGLILDLLDFLNYNGEQNVNIFEFCFQTLI